jgi:hypothetical protein
VTTPDEASGTGQRPGELVAGFLCAIAMAGALVALVYRPVRVGLFPVAVTLVATPMAGRNQKLVLFTIFFVTTCWVVGMAVAVLTNRPIW